MGEVYKKYEDVKQDLIFEAEVFYGRDADIKKDIQELLFNLKEEYLKEELGRKMRELNMAEKAGETALATKILKECQIINNKIQEIKYEKEKQKIK